MMGWDNEKPSRQKRRQKRTWKRKPKKLLDGRLTTWQSFSPVLNTPHIAVAAPVSQSGFFTSIGFLWSGSAQSYNTLRGKAASALCGVLKYLTTPQQGGFSTNHIGGHHG